MMDFGGRVAIVTGAGRGIGRAHAVMLASRGCRVVVNDIPLPDGSPGPAHEVAREITAAGGIAIANEDSVVGAAAAIVIAAIDAFGQLDIVLNNAGTTHHRLFEELTDEEFRGQIELHLMGAVDLCRAAWPHLKRSGSGRIINTCSGGIVGNPAISNYAAGKGGLVGFSRCLAFEGMPWNITVNCIFPSAATRLHHDINPRLKDFLATNFRSEQIAAFATWLAHQDTTINNEMFEVGGGFVARFRFAHQSYVHARDDSPEAWAEQHGAVMADGPVTTLSSTAEMMAREINEIDPDFDAHLDTVLDGKH